MPELPEVETTCRGISPHLIGQTITAVRIFHPRLRWPIPDEVHTLVGRTIRSITRRAKYLLMDCETGHLIVHLGMSGSLRIVAPDAPRGKHDHVEIQVGAQVLRLRDPRRFGAVLWTEQPPHTHPLLAHLGVEPLDAAFDGASLYAQTRKVNTPIKLFVMDAKRVVGVGNIYASESLFLAGIDPTHAQENYLLRVVSAWPKPLNPCYAPPSVQAVRACATLSAATVRRVIFNSITALMIALARRVEPAVS
jgi:formamidopyrimidine-DNA glycosylase